MVTQRELAEIIGCSKSTIQRAVKELNIEFVNDKNKYLIKDEDVPKIWKKVDFKGFLRGDSKRFKIVQNESETVQKELNAAQSEAEVPQNNSKSESVNESVIKMLETLQEQLKQKDKQINDLSERLAEANKNLDQAQKLHALAENKIQALELKEQQEEEKKEKHHFWNRKK